MLNNLDALNKLPNENKEKQGLKYINIFLNASMTW